MQKQTALLILAINLAIVSLGGLLVYYDLYMRSYKPIKVDYGLLGYRPTYRVWNRQANDYITVQGGWTLDLLQLSVFGTILNDLFLAVQIHVARKKTIQ